EGDRPDPRKAAEALHMAIQKVRQQPRVQLTDWIPFVHLGIYGVSPREPRHKTNLVQDPFLVIFEARSSAERHLRCGGTG
ncbi:14887_t:CDS:2, partial [Acaulospora colombiana]